MTGSRRIGRSYVALLEAELAVRRADMASGMVPPGATRALFAHELRTDFAGIEASVDATAGVVAKRLADDRAAFVALLEADLAAAAANPGTMPVDVAVAFRVLAISNELGLQAIPGAGQLIDEAEAAYRGTLAAAATEGAARVADEAATYGIDVAGLRAKLGGLSEYRLDLAARRLAEQPHADVVGAAADFAYRVPEVGGKLADSIIEHVRTLSENVLGNYARPPVQAADGLGRAAAATGLVLPERIYASELLDRNTCGPCSMIDGTEYGSLAEAQADYPAGGFKDCEGGDACRGSLVFVWGSEVPPAT